MSEACTSVRNSASEDDKEAGTPEAERCALRLFELVREGAAEGEVGDVDIETEENEELREWECEGRYEGWSESSSSDSESEDMEPRSDKSRSEPLSPTLNCEPG